MNHITSAFLLICSILMLHSCKKNKDLPGDLIDNNTTRKAILTELSTHVIAGTYVEMTAKSDELTLSIEQLNNSKTEDNLNICRNNWRALRAVWKQSEGFIFGPVATERIDPRIDSWPINHADLDSLLSTSVAFESSYIDGLQDALKGFHPIEYLLFGINGDKAATEITNRELELLVELSKNLTKLSSELASNWAVGNGNYYNLFTSAGNGSSLYASQKEAFEELTNAIIGICDEVAGGKIAEPFNAQNPNLEESPYSRNSLNDFINNIKSVQNIYLGKFQKDGKGLEDFVRVYNLSLDATIKLQIDQALFALNAITLPFGEAISSQPTLVQQAIDKIDALRETLESQLLPLIQLQIS
jgi:predicted lipoprotein